MLLILAIAAPFAAALLAPFLGRALGARAGWVLAGAFLPGLGLLTIVAEVRSAGPVEASLPWVPTVGLELAFRADGFSLMFALLVAGIGFLILLYSASYLGRLERHGRFYTYLLLFGGAMMGLVLADNMFILFGFWELTSITSYLLIGFWDGRRASQDGALKALVITMLGGLALLVAVILLALGGGSDRLSGLDLIALKESPYFVPAMILALFAAFSKSAQLPFHLWLPTAMEAPTPVSAYLHSATMVKAGVILIAKFSALLAGTDFATAVLLFGLATMFWGSYLALRQTDLKALLAYSTVSQLGILVALYGSGDAFAATAQLVNHAAFKATLFLVVGIIDHETGSRDLRNLSGLGRRLPITMLLAVPAALSMAGLPPFGGFISKELFYEGMLQQGSLPILIAVLGSVMTFAYSVRFLSVFFGPYRCDRPDVHEAAPQFWLPIAPLTAAVVVFGLIPFENTAVGAFTALAAPSFGYHNEPLALWHGPTVAFALSVLTWFLGIALYIGRAPFLALQRRLTPRWNANTLYYALLGGLERLSAGVVRGTLGAGFATHLRLILAAIAVVGALSWWRFLPPAMTTPPIEVVVAGLLIAAGAVGVLAARSRLSALIFMGLAGFGSALVFLLLRAPDLALTQLLIETVTVILFLSVFRYLPVLTRYSRPRRVAAFDALVAAGVGMTVFTLLLAVQNPVRDRISDFFIEFSKSIGGGNNVVNVILVDFRGYDTLGEITVLAIVAVSALALLRLRVGASTDGTAGGVAEAGPDDGADEGDDDARG